MSKDRRPPTGGPSTSEVQPARPEVPSDRQAPRCPLCGRPRVQQFRPFCSARCRDVDLAHWFGEAYAVPVVEPGFDDDDQSADGGRT